MCIGCAACIDACDQVMEKMGYPKGLIRYSTQNAIDGKYPDKDIFRHTLRPRTLFYTVLLLGIVAAFIYTLAQRVPLRVDVLRDRHTLSREAPTGGIENLYRLQIINMDDQPHRYVITVTGIDGLRLTRGERVEIAPLATEDISVVVEAPRMSLQRPSYPIVFRVQSEDDPAIVREAKSSFLR
jgi:polyferredoxin